MDTFHISEVQNSSHLGIFFVSICSNSKENIISDSLSKMSMAVRREKKKTVIPSTVREETHSNALLYLMSK